MWKPFFVLTILCFTIACGSKKEEPAVKSQSSSLSPELRKSFMEGCTGEIVETFGKENSETMCSCMLEKGLAKWGLGEFMKKAMDGGPEVEKISEECLKTALGADAPDEASDPAPAEAAGGDEIRSSFLEGCVEPLSKEIGTGKARTMCACMYDKGIAKWGLGDFMKKAMEQGDDVQNLAMECAANL